MTVALLALAMTPVAYKFEPSTQHHFKVDVAFDGFIPILGGNEGVVDAKLGVSVSGQAPKGAHLQATNELTAFEISFNKAKLPLSLESAVEYFPKTTIALTPFGRIIENSAPEKQLVVRLPGLDVKRFPDITYAPLEFPEGGIENGLSWKFTKSFDGAEMVYNCTAKNVTAKQAEIDVKVKQSFETLENEALEVVKSEADAVNRVKTEMTGAGTILFDLEKGIPNKVVMNNSSVSKVTPIKGGATTDRNLKSTLRLVREGFNPAPAASTKPAAAPATLQDQVGQWWNAAVQTGQSWWTKAEGYVALARLALAAMFSGSPLPMPNIFGGK